MKTWIKHKIIHVLVYLVSKLQTTKQPIKSLNRQDMELITKAFPPFSYNKSMTCEDIALSTMQCYGEQRVIQYLMSRIQGRVGQGVAYD